jgi:hypothetical protein
LETVFTNSYFLAVPHRRAEGGGISFNAVLMERDEGMPSSLFAFGRMAKLKKIFPAESPFWLCNRGLGVTNLHLSD